MKRKLEEEIGLNEEEITSFIQNGFVLLKNAFPREVAEKASEILWTKMDLKYQIKQNKPDTWPERQGIPEIYDEKDNAIWGEVFTPRLTRALNQLCGEDRWVKFGLGWWVIGFPGHHAPPWSNAGKWHVDGAKYQHHIDSKESGLLPIFLFSDIKPTHGGTALVVGSHKTVANILNQHEPRGLKGSKVSMKAIQQIWQGKAKTDYDIIEVNGEAGDVMLTHPFLLHARSKNLSENNVRFMCNPNVCLKRKMNICTSNENDDTYEYSAVESAIIQALKETVMD